MQIELCDRIVVDHHWKAKQDWTRRRRISTLRRQTGVREHGGRERDQKPGGAHGRPPSASWGHHAHVQMTDKRQQALPRTPQVTLGGRRTADAGDGSELRVGRVSEPRGGCREAVCALAGAGQPPFGVSRALGRVHGAVARRATLLAAHVAPAARPRPLYERGPLAQPPHAPLAAGARKRACAVSPRGEGVSVSLRRVRASQA